MQDLIFFGLLGMGGAAFVAGIGPGKGKPVWTWPLLGGAAIAWWLTRHGAMLAYRGAVAGTSSAASRKGIFGFRRRVSDAETAELIERQAIIPARTPLTELQRMGHGKHWTPAGILRGHHCVIIAQAGAGKGQTVLNYQIQYQLQHSDEHVIIMEVKRNHELSKIVAAYARPQDRIWIYTNHPGDKRSSSLTLTNIEELKTFFHSISHEPQSKDPHWNAKSANLYAQVALAVTDFKDGRTFWVDEEGPITANLGELYDVIRDRETLEALREGYRNVDNVADESKEWGYIRSNALRHLEPLSSARIRRVFKGRANTPQPRFRRYPDGGRDIVIFRPAESSAEREARYVIGMMDIALERALDAGYAGGEGVKVILDEFASFLDIGKMRHYLDAGRGGGLNLCYVLQSRKQLAAQLHSREEADSIIDSTEIKVIGATSDQDLANQVAEWGGKETVDYRAARQRGRLLSDWIQGNSYTVKPKEITSQKEGEWTIVHAGEVIKRKVDEAHRHHTQAMPPRKMKIRGVVKEA